MENVFQQLAVYRSILLNQHRQDITVHRHVWKMIFLELIIKGKFCSLSNRWISFFAFLIYGQSLLNDMAFLHEYYSIFSHLWNIFHSFDIKAALASIKGI